MTNSLLKVSYTSRVSQCCQCEAEADLVDKVLARMEEAAEQTVRDIDMFRCGHSKCSYYPFIIRQSEHKIDH